MTFASLRILLVTGFAVAGCGGTGTEPPPPGPTVGTLRVIVGTTGDGAPLSAFALRVDGGADSVVAPKDTVVYANLSPGAHAVAFHRGAANCRPATDTSATITITAGVTSTAAFSADCFRPFSQQVLVALQGDIWVMSPVGQSWQRLTDIPGTNQQPTASPDGLHFAFVHQDDSRCGLRLADADGKNVRILTDGPYSGIGCDLDPAWSPDGSRIAFRRHDSDDIWVMDADGQNPQNITNTASSREIEPQWSPDGSRLVYSVVQAGGGLFTMRPDGTDTVRLTNDSSDQNAEWSHAGTRIAFSRLLPGSTSVNQVATLYTIAPDGSGLAPLTEWGGPPIYDNEPTWTIDDFHVLFTRFGSNLDAWSVSVADHGLLQLTTNQGVTDIETTW